MKKNNKFSVLSNKICACGKAIKQNLIDKNPNAHLCYSCFSSAQANDMATAREVRTGKKAGRKKGIYFIE